MTSMDEQSFVEILMSACVLESGIPPEQKRKQQNHALATLHSVLHLSQNGNIASNIRNPTASFDIVKLIKFGPSTSVSYGNNELDDFHRQIRQIVCIGITVPQSPTSNGSNTKNAKAKDITWKCLAWETLALLLESCGGKWILESETSAKKKERKRSPKQASLGIGGTLCFLLQLCSGEIRIQLGSCMATAYTKKKSNRTNADLNFHAYEIVHACSRVIIAMTALLISLAGSLDEDDEDEDSNLPLNDWVDLPFDAILHLKQSLDDAHDSMFQYLAALNDISHCITLLNETTSPNDTSARSQEIIYAKQSIKLGLVCARCIGAWLSETEIMDITSPSPSILQQSILNAVRLCNSMMSVPQELLSPSSSSMPPLVYMLPALVKIISDHNTLFSMDDYFFMGHCIHGFMNHVRITTTIGQNVDINGTDGMNYVEPFLLLPYLSWVFLFFQKYKMKMNENGSEEHLRNLQSQSILSIPEEEEDRMYKDEDENSFENKVSTTTMLSLSVLQSIAVIHTQIFLIPHRKSHQKLRTQIQENEVSLQLFCTLCDGVQCWFNLFFNSESSQSSQIHANNETKIPLELFSFVFDTIFGTFLISNQRSFSLSEEMKDMLTQTADCVYPHIQSLGNEENSCDKNILFVSEEIIESVRRWIT